MFRVTDTFTIVPSNGALVFMLANRGTFLMDNLEIGTVSDQDTRILDANVSLGGVPTWRPETVSTAIVLYHPNSCQAQNELEHGQQQSSRASRMLKREHHTKSQAQKHVPQTLGHYFVTLNLGLTGAVSLREIC